MRTNAGLSLRYGSIFIAASALLVAVGSIAGWGRKPPVRRSLEVSPPSRRVIADVGEKTLSVAYTIKNTGDRPVNLGAVATTCGCSVASIGKKELGPGDEAEVRVVGEPPPVGEKRVVIRVATDAQNLPEVALELVMVGPATTPYVAFDSKVISFGDLNPGELPARRDLVIMTRETAGRPPWIGSVATTVDGLAIRGGLAGELTLGPLVVARTYRYTATLERGRAGSAIDGTVRALGERSGQTLLELPVTGLVRPLVFAEPAAIFAVGQPDQTPPVRFDLIGDGATFNPVATDPHDPDHPFHVRRVSASPGRVAFELVWTGCDSPVLRSSVGFQTGLPESPSFVMPLTWRPTAPLGASASRAEQARHP